MAMREIIREWRGFVLAERNFTAEELASNDLWNDLSQEEIDGFFWGAAGEGTLDFYTELILDLAKAVDGGSDISFEGFETVDEWKEFRDEVMEYRSIGEAYDILAPRSEHPDQVSTSADSPVAQGRKQNRKKQDLRDKAKELLDSAIAGIQNEHENIDMQDILQLFNDEIESYRNSEF
jgi:hypothetical protein